MHISKIESKDHIVIFPRTIGGKSLPLPYHKIGRISVLIPNNRASLVDLSLLNIALQTELHRHPHHDIIEEVFDTKRNEKGMIIYWPEILGRKSLRFALRTIFCHDIVETPDAVSIH